MANIHTRIVSPRNHAGKKDGQIIIRLTKPMKELTMDDYFNIRLITNEQTGESIFYQIPVPVIREHMHNKGSNELHLNPFKADSVGASTYSFTPNTSGKWQKYLIPSHKMDQFNPGKKTGHASLTELFVDNTAEYGSRAEKYRLERELNTVPLNI